MTMHELERKISKSEEIWPKELTEDDELTFKSRGVESNAGRRPIAEFAGPSGDAAAAVARAAGGGARDVDIGSGNL